MDQDDARDFERYVRDKNKAMAKGKLAEVAQLCNCIGEIHSKYGRHEEAIQEHFEEKRISEALADRIGEAVACRLIGECYCALGQYKDALDQQKRHLTLARECQNDLEEQRAWATIGRTYLCQADSRNVMESSLANKQAEKSFFKALEACEKVKASRSVSPTEYMAMKARLFLNIGLVYDNRCDLKQSADAMKKAVMIAEKYKLDNELQMCQASLAAMYQNGGKHTEAVRTFEVALRLARKLRDKVGERDLLISKAMTHVAIGDFIEAKHCLKKAHKLKIEGNISTEKLRKLFRTATKIQEARADLDTVEDGEKICRLHEIIADGMVELGNCKEAIASYVKVLSYSHLLSPNRRAAIYISLAQTYADDKQYNSAIFYYKKELDIQKDNPEQLCRTNLNIAELEELNGSKYASVCKIYMEAFDQAKKAKHGKLMVQTLKSLIELQKLCQQQKHLEHSEKTLAAVKKKYGDREDTEESQEEEEDCDDKAGKEDDEAGNLSVSDLTVSDETDEGDGELSVNMPRKKKSNFARTNEKGETPLHRACINGSLKKVKALVSEGHPLNPRDYCGWIPLHEAANHGFTEIVEYLLENGAWINDRGGERCGGVTPLIDAANCGNLEVVQVLLNHGANVNAKDDDGNTAHDCLEGWYNRAIKVLEASDVLEYKKTEKLLLDCNGKNGTGAKKLLNRDTQESSRIASIRSAQSVTKKKTNALQPLTMRLPDLVESDEEPQKNTSASVKAKLSELREKRMKKNSRKSSKNRKSTEEISSNSDSSDMENSFVHLPTLDNVRMENNNATEVYQSAMLSVRTSAQNRVDEKDHQESAAGVKNSDQLQAPYMESEMDIGDDWLIDDVEFPKRKKRSADVTKILTTTTTRSNTSASGAIKKRRIIELDSSDKSASESSLNSDITGFEVSVDSSKRPLSNPAARDVATHRVKTNLPSFNASSEEVNIQVVENHNKKLPQTASDEELWGPDDDDDFLYDSNFCIGNISTVAENNASLTSVGNPCNNDMRCASNLNEETHNQNKKSDSDNVSESWHFKNQNITKACSSEKTQTREAHKETSDRLAVQNTNQAVSKEVKFSVKVKINDKTFLVPVFVGDENKPIAWLAQQAADRYFSSFLVYPMLTFKSSDGCIISNSDPIFIVTEGISELHADVHAWSRRTAVERYEKACKTFYEEPNVSLKTALQKVGKSSVVDASNLNLAFNQLLPVFQALNGESTLTELNLNGNRLTDASLDSLTKLLDSVSSLKDLKLESNELSAEGLEVLALFVQSSSNLHSLTSLSLSYNRLTDKAEPSLRMLLKSLPCLVTLRLTGCCFTSHLFTPSLLEAFSGCELECVAISENQLTKKSVQSLLEKMKADSLSRLDISQCLQEEAHSIGMESLLHPLSSSQVCCLQSLSLADCHLSREDVLEVIRLPIKIPSLQELVISLNPNITNTSLQKLLYLSTSKGSRLQSLTARGCSIRSPLSEEFLEALKGKLCSEVPLKRFVFSCRALTSAESDLLQSVWSDQWLDLAVVKVSGMIVNLSTASVTEGF